MKIRFGDYTLDVDSRQLTGAGSPIHLSPKAFDLLKLLVERRPSAISKSELHDRIWPGTFVSDDSLSRLIVEVREAIGDAARRPRFVRTLHGFGYAFSADAETLSDRDESDSVGALQTGEEKRIDADRKTSDLPAASWWTWPRQAVGAAILGISFIGGLVVSRAVWKNDTDSRPVSFVVLPPEGAALSPSASLVAVSPDGRHIAFLAVSNNGRRSLWVRPIETITARELPGTDDALAPFWSPDSSTIGFFVSGKLNKLEKIDLAGGLPETITDTDVTVSFAGTWNRQGSILFGGRGPSLFLVSASGGAPRAVTHVETAETFDSLPSFLPDGRHFTFLRQSETAPAEVYVGSLDSPTIAPLLTADSQALYTTPGYLLFLRDGALYAQRFDPKRPRLIGTPARIVERVGLNSNGPRGMFSVSDAGVLAYRPPQEYKFILFERSGKLLQTFGASSEDRDPALSPDGTRLAFDRFDPSTRTRNIWILELDRGIASRLTTGAWDLAPVWSPDGTRVAYRSERPPGQAIVDKPASGGPDERLLVADPLATPADWSERAIFYTRMTAARAEAAVLRLVTNPKSEAVIGTPFNERTPRLSPDGRWLAYSSDETGRAEVYVTPFPGRQGKWLVSTAGGVEPVWRSDGSELFYIAANRELMAASVHTGDSFRVVGTPAGLFQTGVETSGQIGIVGRNQYVASADGQRFVIRQVPPGVQPSPITVVLNWTCAMTRWD